jgi:hypothetical protein
VRPFVVVIVKIASDATTQFRDAISRMDVNVILFQCPPKSLNPDIVFTSDSSVHADCRIC